MPQEGECIIGRGQQQTVTRIDRDDGLPGLPLMAIHHLRRKRERGVITERDDVRFDVFHTPNVMPDTDSADALGLLTQRR